MYFFRKEIIILLYGASLWTLALEGWCVLWGKKTNNGGGCFYQGLERITQALIGLFDQRYPPEADATQALLPISPPLLGGLI